MYWDEPETLFTLPAADDTVGYMPRADGYVADGGTAADSSIIYTVLLDGVPMLTTQKTHATLSALQPATDYVVTVRCTCGETSLAAATVTVTTRARRCRLDVTLPPYNAVGDGATLNTAALQRAFDDCTDSDCVYLPRGVFLTGALRLHSGTELYLDNGAVLQGTARPADYLPYIPSRFEGIEQDCYQSLLNLGELNHASGYNCRDVLIYGTGTIASGGAELAKAVIRSERVRLADYLQSLGDTINECEHKDTIPGRMRPRLINMSNCQNVRITGLTLANGASWNVHFIYSDGVLTDHCTFKSEGVWNGDGWDPDSSTNCTIFACDFYTGDDSVAIKSGKNPQGNAINRPSEHIRVFDCRCTYGHGITIGSEISGGINDVRIWDCDMSASMQGIEIKATKKRGAYVRGVRVHNCKVSRVQIHAVGYNDDGVGAPVPPVFADCCFRNVTVTGRMLDHERLWHDCAAIDIRGFDVAGYEARDIVLDGIVLEKPTAAWETQAIVASGGSAADSGAAVGNSAVADGGVQTLTLACCAGVTLRNISARRPSVSAPTAGSKQDNSVNIEKKNGV